MFDREETLYYGADFGWNERKSRLWVLQRLEDGEIEEVRMPMPTAKRPDRTKQVYRWKGERTFDHRDLSAQMPPCVTELAADGVGTFVACADAWRGHMTPAFRGLKSVPAGILLLINAVTYEDIPLDKEHDLDIEDGLETPAFA